MVSGKESGGGFALVEHPMPPHALGAPLHRHNHEDEYSFVLEGRIGDNSAMLATLSLNLVGSGIHSGTLAISPPESLKSFRHRGLSSISER